MLKIESSERWWQAKDNVHSALVGDVKALCNKLQYRSDQNLKFLRLYSNQFIQSLHGDAYDQPDPVDPDRLVLNIIQSVVNAVTAKISTNRPRCMPLTEGGNWQLQQQAKQLGKYFDGQFYSSKIYRKNRNVFRDACIFGTGAMKFYPDYRDEGNPCIAAERRLIEDVLVDPIDGRFGNPRMLHEVRDMSREVAKATWPEVKGKIAEATYWRSEQQTSNGFADPVTIAEAWHLPSSSTAGDGRHVIACDTATLLDEPWKIERFPMAFFKWLEPSIGWYGDSLASQLVGVQVEINKILLKVSQHMHLASSFICASRATKVVKEHLVNTPWTLLEHTGDKPTFETVASISPEYFLQLDRLYAKAFEIAGITQLFATGLKPKGLDSGKALRESKDTESERFMDVSQAWEELHFQDIPEILVDIAQEIEEEEPGYSVLAKTDGNELERIKFADVDLDRDKYILQLHPTSYLPKLPAFRFQAVKEILEVSPEAKPYALQLLDYPDLKAVTNRITAPTRYIEMVTDRMLYGNEEDLEGGLDDLYEPPDAFTDPAMALEIARGKYQQAKMDKAPEERLELLLRYMTAVEAMAAKAKEAALQAAMPPAPPEAMAPTQAAPMVGDVNISPEISVPEPIPIPGR